MKTYTFNATNNRFMFVTFNKSIVISQQCSYQLDDLIKLFKKYKMTEDDINLIPFLKAKQFELVPSNDDYTFLLKSEYDFDQQMISEYEMIFKSFEGEVKEDDYPIIITSGACELSRIKTNLLPFI